MYMHGVQVGISNGTKFIFEQDKYDWFYIKRYQMLFFSVTREMVIMYYKWWVRVMNVVSWYLQIVCVRCVILFLLQGHVTSMILKHGNITVGTCDFAFHWKKLSATVKFKAPLGVWMFSITCYTELIRGRGNLHV